MRTKFKAVGHELRDARFVTQTERNAGREGGSEGGIPVSSRSNKGIENTLISAVRSPWRLNPSKHKWKRTNTKSITNKMLRQQLAHKNQRTNMANILLCTAVYQNGVTADYRSRHVITSRGGRRPFHRHAAHPHTQGAPQRWRRPPKRDYVTRHRHRRQTKSRDMCGFPRLPKQLLSLIAITLGASRTSDSVVRAPHVCSTRRSTAKVHESMLCTEFSQLHFTVLSLQFNGTCTLCNDSARFLLTQQAAQDDVDSVCRTVSSARRVIQYNTSSSTTRRPVQHVVHS